MGIVAGIDRDRGGLGVEKFKPRTLVVFLVGFW